MNNKQKINNTEQINQLKNTGFDVKITHYRYFGDELLPMPLAFILKEKKFTLKPLSNKGGKTIVVVRKNGKKFVSVADCSKEDQYNYRMGTKICLNRIQKEIDNENIPF